MRFRPSQPPQAPTPDACPPPSGAEQVPTSGTAPTPTAAPARRFRRWARFIPGLLLVLPLALVATLLGTAFPVLGGPVAGVLIGVIVATFFRPTQRLERLTPGVKFASGRLLQTAVVLLGAQVSIPQVLHSGWHSLPVMLGTLIACLIVAWAVGRLLGIDDSLVTLIGVGTAICGASAIAAVTPVLKPAASKVAYALSTIFIFNIAAVIAFPWIGHALGMGQETFGLFAGTAVNDTSSVVAAAATYGQEATDMAVVVKLTRTLMIIPIVLGIALLLARRSTRDAPAANTRPGVFTLVPWFLIGFMVLAGANSIWPFPAQLADLFITASVFLITMALTAIGLSTDIAGLRRTGLAPVLLGLILWITVAGSSLLLQWVSTGLS